MATSTGSLSTSAGPLDVDTLVSRLVAVESRGLLAPLTRKAENSSILISAYGGLKGALAAYQAAIKGLNAASFSAQKAVASNNGSGTGLVTDPFKAEINGDDSTKTLSQKLTSAGFAKGHVFNAGDSIAIKVGTNSPTFITLKANATLEGLRDAINKSSAGVTAVITSDGTGQHLVMESNTGGTANTIKVSANNSLSGFAYDPTGNFPSTVTQTQAPRDATRAAAGNYAIGVSQLAQTQKLSSAGIAPGTTFDSGLLAIKAGSGSTTIIKPANNTISGVRDAINASDAGVTASIVNDGTREHLIIAARESGAANTLRITGTGDFSVLSFDPSGKITSPAVPSSQVYGAGALSLKVGEKTVDINPTDLDGNGSIGLNDVMKSINNAGLGVSASINRNGTQDQLVLTPTGVDAVSLTGTDDYSGLGGSIMGQQSKAQDARITIDGVVVSSSSNKVANAISGVTLNLEKVTTANDKMSLSITNDTSGVSTAATTFVNAYNTLVKAVSAMTKQTPSTTKGTASRSSPLAAQSAVQGIMTQLRSTMFSSTGVGSNVTTLSSVGISFQKDGTLALDAAKLTSASSKDFEGVSNLFVAKNGTVPKLQKLMDEILGEKGILALKTTGLEASQKIITDQQSAINDRLQTIRDRYTNQFNRLNVTLSSMQATQNYLTQQLAAWNKK